MAARRIPAKKAKRPAPKASFIESMECLPVATLPEGHKWTYEIKLDGFRLEAVKNGGVTTLYSRRANILNRKFQYVADALKVLPDATIIDGEVVALDGDNRSDFGLLQNFRSAETRIRYYAFDILMLKGRLLTQKPLGERRVILEKTLPINDHISLSVVDNGSSAHILQFVRQHGLEGVVAKRSDSVYETGEALRVVEQAPSQPRAGIRHRRLHSGFSRLRRAHHRLLPRQGSPVRRPRARRLCPLHSA